jgi:hypothetical protein
LKIEDLASDILSGDQQADRPYRGKTTSTFAPPREGEREKVMVAR